jgi:hypothetical protein
VCELLVRAVDKVCPKNAELDARCTKRGDVIVACRDGHPWSAAERRDPAWRIVKIPGVAPNDPRIVQLLTDEKDVDLAAVRPRRRVAMLNLDSAPLTLRTLLADALRLTPILSVTETVFDAMRATKPAPVGEDRNTLVF